MSRCGAELERKPGRRFPTITMNSRAAASAKSTRSSSVGGQTACSTYFGLAGRATKDLDRTTGDLISGHFSERPLGDLSGSPPRPVLP